MKIGIVGAGWAGLAAAWRVCAAGHEVMIWDMAPQAGGRGRSGVPAPAGCPVELDCGQHILIGAYSASLGLMRELGVPLEQVLHRRPLELCGPDGQGLKLGAGPPSWAFFMGVMRHPLWSMRSKMLVLLELTRWRLAGFRCDDHLTVAQWCRLPASVMNDWIEPLCVAALNTPVERASAKVLMRVLGDALFAGPGGSDLLLPSAPLHDLLPGPALQALARRGADIRLQHRVQSLKALGKGRWAIDGEEVDRLIVATSPLEAARLIEPWDADWSRSTRGLQHEPIVTTWFQLEHTGDRASAVPRLATPMVSLAGTPGPAQFAFDLGAMGHPWGGGLALVSSAPGQWLDRGIDALESAVIGQIERSGLLSRGRPVTAFSDIAPARAVLVRSVAERRATFRCEAGLQRPASQAAAAHGGLLVAGDYVDGPYPSTLEGAVRAGEWAAQAVKNS